MDFLYKASPLGELTDYDEKNSVVKGYGSYFNNKDSDGDIIRMGAYKKPLKKTEVELNIYISTIWINL